MVELPLVLAPAPSGRKLGTGPQAGDRKQPGAACPPHFPRKGGTIPGQEQRGSFSAGSLSPTRLAPMYFSAGVLWVLLAAAALGVLHFSLCHYVGLDVLRLLTV